MHRKGSLAGVPRPFAHPCCEQSPVPQDYTKTGPQTRRGENHQSPFLPQSRSATRWTPPPSVQVEKGRMPPAGQDVPGVQVERAQVVHGNCRPGGCPPLPRTGSNSNFEDSNFTDQLYGPRLPFCLGLPGYSVEVLGALGARAQLAPSPLQKPPRVCEVAPEDVRDEGTLSQNGLSLNGYGISLSLSVSLGHTVVPHW